MDEGTLLLPGPTPVPRSVLQREILAMEDHRGPHFSETYISVTKRLARLFHTTGKVALFPSSGTGGLEAVVQNLFVPGDPILAVTAGHFGERFAESAEIRGLDVDRLEFPWGEAPDVDEVRRALRRRSYKGVLLTHSETSTGVLAPVRELAEVGREAGCLVVVDSISSFPSVPLPMDDWGVDVAVACSQKGFMTPPGLSIVALSERAIAAMPQTKPGCGYFDLTPYLTNHLPYTPAVSLINALTAALDLLEQESEEARSERHYCLAKMARAAGVAMGLEPLVAERFMSPTVTALRLPVGTTTDQVRTAAARFGLSLGGGLGKLAGKIIRIGHVGYVSPGDLLAGIGRLQLALEDVWGRPVTEGLPAAYAVLREETFTRQRMVFL